MVHLKKIYLIFIIVKKLLFGLVQTHLFLTGSLLWHHKQPSCFHCGVFTRLRYCDGAQYFTLRFTNLPQAPLTTLLIFHSAAVQGPWTAVLDLGAPVRFTEASQGPQCQPSCKLAAKIVAGLLLPADFALAPGTFDHGRPEPGLRGCHKDVLISRATEHRCQEIT